MSFKWSVPCQERDFKTRRQHFVDWVVKIQEQIFVVCFTYVEKEEQFREFQWKAQRVQQTRTETSKRSWGRQELLLVFVNFHVCFEISALCESSSTREAFKRSFSWMDHEVSFQALVLGEHFPAGRTDVPLLWCLRPPIRFWLLRLRFLRVMRRVFAGIFRASKRWALKGGKKRVKN